MSVRFKHAPNEFYLSKRGFIDKSQLSAIRTESPAGGKLGELNEKDVVYYEDVIKLTYKTNPGYYCTCTPYGLKEYDVKYGLYKVGIDIVHVVFDVQDNKATVTYTGARGITGKSTIRTSEAYRVWDTSAQYYDFVG